MNNNNQAKCENISTIVAETQTKNNMVIQIKTKAKMWHDINWRDAYEKVRDQQEAILKAAIDEDWNIVYRLQRKLINSFAGRAIAVRRVISNSGGKTPGVDNIVIDNPEGYYQAIEDLKGIIENPKLYKASPVRRVMIPKPGKKEMRPLGIPTVKDRIVQAVYHLAVDPVVEHQSDLNSFGFRIGRSTQDAVNYFRNYMDKTWSPQWVLEADITQCFPSISHEFLLKHTPICDKEMLRQWLKAGMVFEGKYSPTEVGTPQGGIISPLLCNVALNGLEEWIKDHPEIKAIKAPKIKIIRYADDIALTGDSKEILEICRRIISEFIKERGLELHETKTKITHIEEGIDLLGFNIRRQNWIHKWNAESKQEKVLIIKPSEKGKKALKQKIRKIIKASKSMTMIVNELNPMLRGWAEHKRITPHSRRSFFEIDNYVWALIRANYITRSKESSTRVRDKFRKYRHDNGRLGTDNNKLIYSVGRTIIKRLRLKRLDLNPYLKSNGEYFLKYRESQILFATKEKLFKKYNQICPVCGEALHGIEKTEIHHIKARKDGGSNSLKNLMPVHSICHRKLTHGSKE